jgi:hypothetical protein
MYLTGVYKLSGLNPAGRIATARKYVPGKAGIYGTECTWQDCYPQHYLYLAVLVSMATARNVPGRLVSTAWIVPGRAFIMENTWQGWYPRHGMYPFPVRGSLEYLFCIIGLKVDRPDVSGGGSINMI